MRAIFSLVATALAASTLCSAQTAPTKPPATKRTQPVTSKSASKPDIIFFHGVIYTGVGFAEDKPQTVEAIAIGCGKVIAIGKTEDITRLAGAKTALHDLNSATTGTFIFPGFNDAHTHLGGAGRTKLNVDLTGVKSLADMQAQIKSAADAAPAGHWLTGGNWDHTLWADKVLPTRKDLDQVTGDHPTFLDRIDGHIAIANTAALAAAGVTGKTQPPQGGAIDVDSSGNPTGILRESARGLVYRVIPPPTAEERRKGDELAINDALKHGVTSVQDFSDWEDFLVFEQMEKEGRLHLRISEWLPFKDSLDELKAHRAHHDVNDLLLHTGMLKGFMDGSLGSRTAAMKAPFADDPKNTGLPQYTQDELNKMAVERAAAGFQLGFHAIGDKATSMALDAYAALDTADEKQHQQEIKDCFRQHPEMRKIADACGTRPRPSLSLGRRHRIEHAQVVDPADIHRFKQLGVIASMQPNHLLTDMNWAVDRLGTQRAAYSYAWKAFLDAGVPLAFGTDYPVEPITPFRGLYAAVTRMNEAGTKTYYAENKLTRGQALYAYTQGSAYAEFAEKRKGKLLPGYDADFILVDRDLYKVGASAILLTHVVQTFVAGQNALATPDQ
jgi:predicted amidohydrolase YtcJ